MAPDSGITSFTCSRSDDEGQHLADVHRRLSLALDRANAFGAFVDPRFLIELRDVVGEVLELIGDHPGCRHGCKESGFHCPIDDPLEKKLAQLQESGWILSWDDLKAQVARDTVCLCGSPHELPGALPGER
jgi:hypothetical protein